jgi:RNA polymerase sigma-70 factor, ECF subfamily
VSTERQQVLMSKIRIFTSSIVSPAALYNVKEPAEPFMVDDDAALLRNWRKGDAGAFAVLVRRWQQPMARFLVHLVGQREIVQDLCQEVFLRVYLAAPRYRESGQFSAWLYRIALNVAHDFGRRRNLRLKSFSDAEPPAAVSGPELSCEQQETAAFVSQAIAELPEPLRVVLILRHYESMSFEQMARLLQTPASTLKSRFAAALARLRERLSFLVRDPEESTS